MAANTARLEKYRALYLNGEAVGLLSADQRALLGAYGLSTSVWRNGYRWVEAQDLNRNTARLAEITAQLAADGLVPGWRGERYALGSDYQHPPQALIERAAMPLFGGCGYGVHVNGLVRKTNGLHMWLGRRAKDKPTDPGKLDQIAAGGQPWGISAFANMQKECAEEAGIAGSLSANAVSVGMSSYFHEVENGLRADVMFLYDLFLPEDFRPHNRDGEVTDFRCLPIGEIPDLLRRGDTVKFNSALVMIDCCLRHGVIDEQEPGYQEICDLLHPRAHWLARLCRT